MDSKEAKLEFRALIKKQLDELDIKPFNKNERLAVKISFYTSPKNRTLLHNLVKNYLDLLHKPFYSRKEKRYLDSNDGLLFFDDSQIKVLCAEKIKYIKSRICIQICLVTELYQDLSEIGAKLDSCEETYEECFYGGLNSFNKLKQIKKGQPFLKRFQLLSDAQKEFLYKSQLKVSDFKYFFSPEFPSYQVLKEEYRGGNELTKPFFNGGNHKFTAYKRLRDMVTLSIGFENVDFNRTNNSLKIELNKKIKAFKKQNDFLFPFITPVVLTVIVMQSRKQVVKDLDNLVKEVFIKRINSTLKAPENPIVPFFELGDVTQNKCRRKRGVIDRYQVIEIEFDVFNSQKNNGWIGFCLGDKETCKDLFTLVEKYS